MSRRSSPQLFAGGDAKENYSPVTIRKARSASSNSTKSSRNQLPLSSSSVKVVCRIKKDANSSSKTLTIERKPDGKHHVMVNNDYQHAFPFDTALTQDATQIDTYNAVIGDGIDHCLRGYHVCVVAYGQTGSGKTYRQAFFHFGVCNGVCFSITGVENNPGVLPLFANNLFEKIADERLENDIYVSLCFYEIYQEKVYDLLSTTRKALRVRGSNDDPFVEGLIEVGVEDKDEMEKWRRIGLSRRATAATLVNELSSRSHAIFCIKVQREFASHVVVSKCFFVDLAGSEKISTSGDHLFNESVSINKSLLALQRVVDARASNTPVPSYRDSVLTRLLRNCFAGNSLTTLLATVSPLDCYFSESLNTLRFASKAAQIVQAPTINEEVGIESVAYLREQNDYYVQKISEMAAQIECLKLHSVISEKIQAPAILELYQDESLNRWTKLETGLKFFVLEGRNLAEFIFNNGEWSVCAVDDGVHVNGGTLPLKTTKLLKHGDIISFYERKFCAVYLDQSSDHRHFANYDRAKLQYVEAVYEKQRKEFAEQIIAETIKTEKEVREGLENELGSLKNELAIKNAELLTKSGEEKYAVKKECEMVESMINDAEDVKKNLNAAVTKETEEFRAKIEDSEEDKALRVAFQSKIEMMNNLLNVTGKIKIFEFRCHDMNSVKIFNKRNSKFFCS
jgi:hypothetical protein